MTEPKLNTKLKCEECGEEFGSVCMLSPDWSALEQFRNAARYHFETKHGMKVQGDYNKSVAIEGHFATPGKMDKVYGIMDFHLPAVIQSPPSQPRLYGPRPCCCCRC